MESRVARQRLSDDAIRQPDLAEIGQRLDELASQLSAWVRRNGASEALWPGTADWAEVDSASMARSIRNLIRQRRARARFFPPDLFADPAWDILLDLTAARLEGSDVPISSLCIAAGVPTTTALRWIATLVDLGLLLRRSDKADRRRVFVELTDHGWDSMSRFLASQAASGGTGPSNEPSVAVVGGSPVLWRIHPLSQGPHSVAYNLWLKRFGEMSKQQSCVIGP